MKKFLLGGMLLFVCSLTTYAQNKNITVSGTIIEAESKEAILQASVQMLTLPDSTFVTGIASDTRGVFSLPKVTEGNYLLKITYIGFQTKYIPLKLSNKKSNSNLGTIALDADAILLAEAVITAEAPPVQVVEDTVVYAASAYRTAEGAMLEELVKKLPGAEVSEEGKITINGKEVKKIMVDGKEFFSDDPSVSMKNLPVNMVENVKAYDRKSDNARITGIDDGDEETVLDLTVKKGMKQGWIGNLIAGYGSEDRHELGAMLSRFKDDASISFVGNANNTNNQGFSEFGDAGQGMSNRGGRRGITTSRSLGMNFAKDTKKLQVGGNVQYGYSDNDSWSRTSSEKFRGEESSFNNSESSSGRQRHDVRVDFRLEWRPDSMTTIIFRPNASYSNTKSNGVSYSTELNNAHELVNEKQAFSNGKSNNFSFNGRLTAFRRLNTNGRNVAIGANFGYSDSETNSDSETSIVKFLEEENTELMRHTDKNGDNRNWSINASYTEPIFKNNYLQLRYEFAHRKRLSESLVSDLDSIMPNGYVESLSSRVENFYDTHNIEASLRGIYPKLMYSAGVTYTPQSSRSETTIGPNTSNQLPTQRVNNYAPSVMLRYRFNKQHVLMLRYRGRSSEPDIEDLQEVINQTDPLNIHYGNPNLKPSFTHNLMMYYNNYIPKYMRSYSFNLFYTNTQNDITNHQSYNSLNGTTVYRRVNINGNWSARGFFSFNTPLKNKKFTISSNTGANISDVVGYTSVDRSSESSESEKNTTHNLALSERLTANYRTDKFDISLKGSVNYNKADNNKQTNSNRETFDYYIGGNTNITLPWSLYLSTDVDYRIKEGYSSGLNNNEVIWNAQISKTIFKKNNGTIRFKIYDILKQQSNLSRSISQSAITDTESNVLGSYFMVHFVYRLNTLGGKSRSNSGQGFSGGERRPRPGGGGGPGGGGHRMW
ncbi:hypothetical protein D0T50_12060 [Bacteroides sp. 214]|uniref:outer membrane beta-barrel family protein n=1 Tax=Bacteroides sp. 214 TaxID=2302935 RepID=UPI0013D3D0B5|nr:outer membrane beta-barrel family protein [Bacteroides sp. 214]NDW13619.1 hypothetical protein [Bacteroides sp. 214]